MDDLTNLKSCQLSNLDEDMIQLMISPKKSAMAPSVISLSNPEVVAVDGDELKQINQFHEEVLEKPWKLISCGNKSSRNASTKKEVDRCQPSDTMAIPEDDGNNADYTRHNDRIIKYSSTDRCDMPEHLLFDILLWLPVITLLRFKSICKSWYSLIDSSIFIAQHFDHNSGQDNILGEHNVYSEHEVYTVCLLSGNKYEVYDNFDCGQFGSAVHTEYVTSALSSNGIICLLHYDCSDIDLWNPAMKQLRSLPKSSVSYESDVDTVSVGFGYSVKSNDYKVVRIVVREENLHSNVVEVYSLRADCWRTILKDADLPLWFLQRPISKNGACFWVSYTGDRSDPYTRGYNPREYVLVSFDLNDETFGTMPLPGGSGSFTASLEFLGDKLAYMYGEYSFPMNGPRYYEIWVMHEYGVKESWNKVWKIGPTDIPGSDDVRFPFGFSKNGDYLLLTSSKYGRNGCLYLYNLGTEENEYLDVLQHPYQYFRWFAHYNECLVSIKRENDAV